MINGIKSTTEGDFCMYCNAKVIEGSYNFCPKCGNPLNYDAIRLNDQKENKIKIELLDELAFYINDVEALKVIANKAKSL